MGNEGKDLWFHYIWFWNYYKPLQHLYNYFADEKYIYLVQELCYSGQLFLLLKKKKALSEELTRNIVYQICRALDYMHECEIIHRDLKP